MLLQYISAEKLNTTAKPKTLNPCVEFLKWIDEILQICLVVSSSYHYQGRIEPLKAARGRIDGKMLSVTKI